jgi:hypothetical protein
MKEERDAARAEIAELRAELDLWRPLTPEEAERAYAEAEAVPMSEGRIQEILRKAMDPAERLPNNEQVQLTAEVRRLRDALHASHEEAKLLGGLWDKERAELSRLRGLLDRMLARFARVAGRSIRLKEENAELRKARDGMETACNICYDVMAQRAKESAELQAELSRLREENAALRGEGKP